MKTKGAHGTGTGTSTTAPSFLKTGNDAKKLLEQAEARDEQRALERDKLWRFFISKENVGEDFRITFLDGDLTDEGMLDIPLWNEHTVYHNGRWQSFIEVTDEPDPIKETTGKDPSLVGGLTIIDHSQYKGKNDKVYENKRKLYVPKRKTLAQLTKFAAKKGGLAGTTWEISRSNEDAASVGDMFEFIEKRTLAELKELYKDEATPAVWAEELTYYSRDQLVKMGFGTSGKIGGSGPSKDLSSEL